MTPQEKAKEIIDKFIPLTKYFSSEYGWEDDKDAAKDCALITVDEILNAVTTIADKKYEFWKQVKEEIEKLT